MVITDHQPLTHLMEQQVLSRLQSRWLRLGLFLSIQPKVVYQLGRPNIVADALLRSRPIVAKSEESAHQEQQDDQDAEKQYDQAFTVTSSVRVEESELMAFRDAQQADPMMRKLLELPEVELKCKNFGISPQGILVKVEDNKQRLVVPQEMRQKILQENYDVPTIGHVGIQHIVDLVKWTYWWCGLWSDAAHYVRSCLVCQRMKSDNRKKAGALLPIPLPERAWQQITTDLVTDLPESEGNTAVAVFVDRLTKMVHFFPCTKEITAAEYAHLFVNQVFRLHGMPEVIISDRDPRFMSKFWEEMFSLLGTDLQFSTAFHPETDGQSEVTIHVLENFLRPYIEHRPSTWTAQLPLSKFAINNAVNVSIGFTPFHLNSGQHPIIPTMLLARGKPMGSNEAVKEALERMKTALADAQTNLQRAQKRMKRAVDKRRRSEMHKVGDEVILTIANLHSYCPHLPPKIKARWVGPFHITREISPVTYELDLLPSWRIHPSSMLAS